MTAPSQYAQLSDLANTIPAAALTSLTAGQQTQALIDASVYADGFLNDQYQLPLVSWSTDLTKAVCMIASYSLMLTRGFMPGSSHNENFRQMYDDANKWLDGIARGKITPPGIVDSSSGGRKGIPAVQTGVTANMVQSGLARSNSTTGRGW